jgi:hypothetical protein
MSVATILVLWCVGSVLLAPFVGRAIRASVASQSRAIDC